MLTWHSEFILNKGQRRLDGLIVNIPDYLNDSSAVNQVTLTLVSHRFPRKLIHYLQEKFSSTSSKILEKVSNGIY